MGPERTFCVFHLLTDPVGYLAASFPGLRPFARLMPRGVAENLVLRRMDRVRPQSFTVAAGEGQPRATGFRLGVPLYSRMLQMARAAPPGAGTGARPSGRGRAWRDERCRRSVAAAIQAACDSAKGLGLGLGLGRGLGPGSSLGPGLGVAGFAADPALMWLEHRAQVRPGWPGTVLGEAVVEAATATMLWDELGGRATRGPAIGLVGSWTAGLEAFALACVASARFVVIAVPRRRVALAIQRAVARETGISSVVVDGLRVGVWALADCDAVVVLPPRPYSHATRDDDEGEDVCLAECLGATRGTVVWLPSPSHVVAAMVGAGGCVTGPGACVAAGEAGGTLGGRVVTRLLFRSVETEQGETARVAFNPWEAAAPLAALEIAAGDGRAVTLPGSWGRQVPVVDAGALRSVAAWIRRQDVVIGATEAPPGQWPCAGTDRQAPDGRVPG